MPPEDPTTLADWLALTHPRRAHHRAEAASRAATSTHGDWLHLADPVPHEPGPLAGIPFAVKDNIDVEGLSTTAGSPLLDTDPACADATVVSAVKALGGVVLGKTNLHELAFGITSNNRAFGPVRNPADPARTAGGSSGGSAACVALGTVPFALGTDTGGSVTVPSSYCGIVGFRPTTGRYPGDGVVNLSTTRDTIGLHTRTAHDARVLDELITGEPAHAPIPLTGLRVGIVGRRYADLEPELSRVAAETLSSLEQAGARLIEVDLPNDIETAEGAGFDLVFHEAPRLLARRVHADPSDWPGKIASPDVRALIESMHTTPVTSAAYAAARAARLHLRRAYLDLFTRVDVLLFPTSPVLPPHIGEDDVITHNGRLVPTFPTVTRNVAPGTVVGLPMLTLPAGTTATGLAVGITLESHPFADTRLLRTAESVETALRPNA
ncbi:amidase family protein [Actinokineospora enzanensis]|uniref:amidase family protein n=1 Tax=Actinokineospora enzanensis TaxID=155975 RepID=UPI00035DCD1F|nr:amidase family protein [Actinokineospora enzanensis]